MVIEGRSVGRLKAFCSSAAVVVIAKHNNMFVVSLLVTILIGMLGYVANRGTLLLQ